MDIEPVPSLTPQQQLAVQYLCLGLPRTLVSQEVGVSRRTLYEWERLPAFQDAVSDYLNEAQTATRMKLRSLASEAVETLRECMTSESSPWPIRYQAASKLLDFVLSEQLPSSPLTKGSKQKGLTDETAQWIRKEILGFDDEPPQKRISPDTLRTIREDVYGIYDSENP